MSNALLEFLLRHAAVCRLIVPAAGLLALCLVSGGRASAAVLKVPSEYANIQAGIDAANPGDTVIVADGTYTGFGNVDVTLRGKQITVASANGPTRTIVDCQGTPAHNHVAFSFDSGEGRSCVLNGFTVKNGYGDHGGGIDVYGSSPSIENCIFVDNTCYRNGGGAIHLRGSDALIDGCSFTNNRGSMQDGYYYGDDGGAIAATDGSPTIADCIFRLNMDHHNAGGAIGGVNCSMSISHCTFTENYGATIYFDLFYRPSCTVNVSNCTMSNNYGQILECTDGTVNILKCVCNFNDSGLGIHQGSVTNCTFYGNTHGAVGIGQGTVTNCTFYGNNGTSTLNGGSTAVIKNCIMYDQSLREIDSSGVLPTVSYSDIKGGFGGTTNIKSDPKFVNPDAGDFHLLTGSPCLGKGTSYGAPADDIEGKPRANPPNMGAYEGTGKFGGNPIDFNGDGKVDLALQSASTRQIVLWYMNAASRVGGEAVVSVPSSGWKVVSAGDFNGDGKPDLVLQNATTRQVALWYLNGASLTTAAYIATTPASGWKVVGSADFNRDGKRDLVLQNVTSNKIAIWYLNGTAVSGGDYVSSTPAAGWSVAAVGDFNTDGKPDLALQNPNGGRVAFWYMNGATLASGGYVSSTPAAGWIVMGQGDFNGDDKPDLVLQNTSSHQIYLWYLNNAAVLGGGYTSIAPGSDWSVVGPR